MNGIQKSFPGVLALDQVNFALRPGEIHTLMGENGAGKSTLIKVLTGVYPVDSGEIILHGNRIEPRSPADAQRAGISTVYQEVNLIPSLSVAENIFLGRQPFRKGLLSPFKILDWAAMKSGAEAALLRLDLRLDVTLRLDSHSIAVQQMVAIARALDVSAQVLILDEPTSSLDVDEVKQLFQVMRRLRDQGLGILFVSHFLDQVYEISDRITILRNGKLIGTYKASELPRMELIAKMMGKELADFESAAMAAPRRVTGADLPQAEVERSPKTLLKVQGLGKLGSLAPVHLEMKKGETLGLAGLLGSGRSELARLLFGIDRADEGRIELSGSQQSEGLSLSSPRDAVQAGFALIPEDRKTQGIFPDLSIRENLILAFQAKKGWFKTLDLKAQYALVEHYIKAIGIVAASPEQAIKTLSGGNQQKVILARWLASQPQLLILDEPTRGIDVGAKAEIQKLIVSLCQQGMAVLFISSELEEVVRVSERVVVLKDHRKIGELKGTEISEHAIMNAIASHSDPELAAAGTSATGASGGGGS
ncbi:MAG: sugar ABC transporter ATP-binding protein [Methylotenera sp.]|nr:sugar ABC transporter ATP-binding protein [Oligoflexia bacterium]